MNNEACGLRPTLDFPGWTKCKVQRREKRHTKPHVASPLTVSQDERLWVVAVGGSILVQDHTRRAFLRLALKNHAQPLWRSRYCVGWHVVCTSNNEILFLQSLISTCKQTISFVSVQLLSLLFRQERPSVWDPYKERKEKESVDAKSLNVIYCLLICVPCLRLKLLLNKRRSIAQYNNKNSPILTLPHKYSVSLFSSFCGLYE